MTAKRYKMLYPVDFSNRCVSAAPYVKTWVDRLDAALDTVHIIGHDPLDPEQDDALRSAERRMADLLRALLWQGCSVQHSSYGKHTGSDRVFRQT
jgi:hypothetical protein